MKCEKCLKERSRGDLYTFTYASKASSPALFGSNHTGGAGKADDRIAGYASAWICDRCVRLAQARYLALVAVLPLLALFAAYQVPGAALACTSVAVVSLIALPVLTLKAKREFGERVARRASRQALKALDYSGPFPSTHSRG